MMQQVAAALLVVLLFLPAAARGADLSSAEGGSQAETLRLLARENDELREKIRLLSEKPAVTDEKLAEKSLLRLRDVASDVRSQRRAMEEFEGFVTWMSANLAGYSKYIQAGSVAAGLAKVLPIPYAGQASAFTKFVSQGVLSLNSASVAISAYLVTSQRFLGMVDGVETAPDRGKAVSDTVRFADGDLLRGMSDVREKLATASEISSSTLSFMEALDRYVGSSDEYWNKTKSFISRKEVDKNEKSFFSQSVAGLKGRTEGFNGKLRSYDETIRRETPVIKTLVAYDELMKEIRQPPALAGTGVKRPGG
jgi:hypothetical protein